MSIPKDPMILLSYLNTHLRDYYLSLEELCQTMELDQETLEREMEGIDYRYDKVQNRFL